MAITKQRKNEIIAEFRTHESDTGSPEVQIAVLTAEINALNTHLQKQKKDHPSLMVHLQGFEPGTHCIPLAVSCVIRRVRPTNSKFRVYLR